MKKSVCSVSVDLDTLKYYYQIHGLTSPSLSDADPVYTCALPRLLELFSDLGVRGTFFVIGQDLENPMHVEVLKRAVAEGHELANHTYNHPYRLTQLPKKELEAEVEMGEGIINELLSDDQKVCGFRCPGYNVDDSVLKILRDRGYRYDSSVFPSASYYLAKGSVMMLLSLKGKPSRSMLGRPEVMWSPLHPYQPTENPHKAAKKGGDIWELPMSVLPGGLPYIGTSILIYPSKALWIFNRLITRRYPFLNLELHGIDMIDPDRDSGLHLLKPHQPDLRVSLSEKTKRFGGALHHISKTHRFLPLSEATSWLEES